jgi:hypothetical protein
MESAFKEEIMKSSRRRVPFFALAIGLAAIALGSCAVILAPPSYIQISNTSNSYTLSHVYITPSSNLQSWGSDLLAPDYIFAGGSTVFAVSPGTYDIEVFDTTNYSVVQYNVVVSAGSTTTSYFNGTTLAP